MNNKYHSFTSFFTDSKSYYINGVEALEVAPDGSKRWFKEGLRPNTGAIRLYLTRSQAYRYWGRHLRDKPCYLLPEVLREALELEDDEVVIVLWADGSITHNRWSIRDRRDWREEA